MESSDPNSSWGQENSWGTENSWGAGTTVNSQQDGKWEDGNWEPIDPDTSEQSVQTSPSLLASAIAEAMTQNTTVTVQLPPPAVNYSTHPMPTHSMATPPVATHPSIQNGGNFLQQNQFPTATNVLHQSPFPTAATTTSLVPAVQQNPFFNQIGPPPGFDNQWNNQMPIAPMQDRTRPDLPYLQFLPGQWDPWCRLC